MPRIVGRKVYPSDLAERRVLQGLGVDLLRAPRNVNPYIIARRLRRAAHANPDVLFLSDVAARRARLPAPNPEPDTPDLSSDEP
jgi:hypothetical protein